MVTVVGIAENTRHFGLDSEMRREFFMPYSQVAWPVMTVVAKTDRRAAVVADAPLRMSCGGVDPDLPVARVQSDGPAVVGVIR